MEIAILETGTPPDALIERFGTYPDMFARLLGQGFGTVTYNVQAGRLPARGAHRACLITGSPAGVYEPLPWIGKLLDFLRAEKGRTKLVGVCFGHQAMAQALGGRVEKSARGWGVGLQRYDVRAAADFMDGEASVAVPVSHQDQVVVQPPGTTLLAASAFTPLGVLGWDDGSALSMQFHPEFAPDYARALIEARRGRLPDPDAAIASLAGPNDRERVAGWLRRFLA